MTNRILIAELSAAHGIKGLVKMVWFGEDVADLPDYNPLYTAKIGDKTLTLHLKNAVKGGYLVAIDGINDRNAAETLRGTQLYVSEDKLKEPEDGEFYYRDLIGCAVHENGENIGKVIAVENFGAGDLLEIQPTTGHPFYLPFTDDTVPDIDIAGKKIDVVIPDGLRDE